MGKRRWVRGVFLFCQSRLFVCCLLLVPPRCPFLLQLCAILPSWKAAFSVKQPHGLLQSHFHVTPTTQKQKMWMSCLIYSVAESFRAIFYLCWSSLSHRWAAVLEMHHVFLSIAATVVVKMGTSPEGYMSESFRKSQDLVLLLHIISD